MKNQNIVSGMAREIEAEFSLFFFKKAKMIFVLDKDVA